MTSGILLLDKPEGLSSNAALQRVKRALGADKAGHAGTLDPLATGMLPILLGEATKVAGHLLHEDKAYRVACRFGQTTTTYDSEGEITRERFVPVLDRNDLAGHLSAFTGRIRQQAPVYSAIKQGGKPLYLRARRGETVEAPIREVLVHRIEIESLGADEAAFQVECGTGTYIRSLVHDLGERIGCGAHVTALRRLWVSPFRQQPMVTLEAMQAGQCRIIPAREALTDWPRLDLTDAEILALTHGKPIHRAGLSSGRLAGVDGDGQLRALLESDSDGRVRCLRLLHPDG
jgi:tRNA pseudouridine55 synthase